MYMSAEDVRPGTVYRWLGPGYLGREVINVEPKCNCETSAGRIDRETGERLHHPVIVITAGKMTAHCSPTEQVWIEEMTEENRYGY